jgi:hypothetical protein
MGIGIRRARRSWNAARWWVGSRRRCWWIRPWCRAWRWWVGSWCRSGCRSWWIIRSWCRTWRRTRSTRTRTTPRTRRWWRWSIRLMLSRTIIMVSSRSTPGVRRRVISRAANERAARMILITDRQELR